MPEAPSDASRPAHAPGSAAASPFSLTRPIFSAAAPAASASAAPQVASNPFSLASGPMVIGGSNSMEGWQATAVAAAPPPAPPAADLRLKLKCSQFGKLEHSLSIPSTSTVSEAEARIRKDLGVAEEDPMTICVSGTGGLKVCSCPTQQLLDAAGAAPAAGEDDKSRTLTLHCLKKKTETTTNPSAAATLGPQAAAAAAAAQRASEAAAAAAAAAAAGANTSSADADNFVRIRRLGRPGQTLEIALTPGMTTLKLKQELERRNEGAVAQLRLLFMGKELMDQLPLALQKVEKRSIIDLALRVNPQPLTSSAASSSMATLSTKRGKFVGLRNQGATCYLNSLIQSVFMTPDFRHAMQQCTVSELPELPQALCRLFSELQTSSYPVSTEAFTSTMRWGSVHRQQDVHEFWTCLCERLESELKDHAMHKLVENLFQGKQRDYVTCRECGRTSYTEDVFQDLKLVVPQAASAAGASSSSTDAAASSSVANSTSDAGHATHTPACVPCGAPQQQPCVATALRELLKPESLCGDEQYFCDHCRCKVDATRGVELRELPRVLTLQLKRFGFDVRTGQRFKVNTPFSFDTTLDMRPYVRAADDDDTSAAGAATGVAAPTPMLYELYAVLVHAGSANFGHYYALIKDLDSSEWYEFNDSRVEPIKESELRRQFGGSGSTAWSGGSSAYMLLYRQRAAGAASAVATSAAAAATTAEPAASRRFSMMGAGPGHVLGRGPAPAATDLAPDQKRHCASHPSEEASDAAVDDAASQNTEALDLSAPMDVDDDDDDESTSANPYACGF